jgi:hypothetical protein
MSEDFTSLNNPSFLYRAGLHHPFPDWVVNEAMPEKSDFVEKSAAAFADPARRLLPICTPSAAFHSAINILACPEEFDEAAFERVKSACAHYGIEQDLLPYAELFADDIEKSAALNEFPEGRFAIDTLLGGEAYQLLPLNDGDDVASSAFDLAKMAADRRIPLLLMVPAAREIVKAAADYDVKTTLPEIVVRYGTPRFADADEAAKLIEGREQFCKDAGIRGEVAKLYQGALEGLEEDPDGAMEKIASIDHLTGIEPKYKVSAGVPNPFDIVFSGALESEAEKAATENLLVRDVLVPLEAVKQIPPLDADFRLSKEAAEDFAKLRETRDARDLSLAVENWPEEDQRTLLRLAVDSAA